jgi:hypothetical protein
MEFTQQINSLKATMHSMVRKETSKIKFISAEVLLILYRNGN